MTPVMDHPFPKSTTISEKCRRLLEAVSPEDHLAVIINADPDSMASAMALKRFFWRRVRRTLIYRINAVQRADNLALIRLLKIDHQHIRKLDSSRITKWAIVDSQPHHDEQFGKYRFDIIIDHHPAGPDYSAQFVDIREEYGANSTIMTEYLRASGIKPSPKLATALFYGIKTDTDNFIRPTLSNDVNAFRYLYTYANINIIKKIESSEITKKTLGSFRKAMDNLTFFKDMAIIHMGKVSNPDILVIIADFFLKLAEVSWCIVSGIYAQKLVVIFRNAGFRRDAGRMASKMFGQWGPAGGHKSAARAEIPLQEIGSGQEGALDIKQFVLGRLKSLSR
ncbi:MAG: exopolyphosphatase [Thermoplasmata archaeon]|nr:MAG: exopolyphosphatase [Thermoplasmata archaeon]